MLLIRRYQLTEQAGEGQATLQTFGGLASRKHRGRTPEHVAAVTSARVVEFGRFGELVLGG